MLDGPQSEPTEISKSHHQIQNLDRIRSLERNATQAPPNISHSSASPCTASTDVLFLVTAISSNETVRTTLVIVEIVTLVAITGNLTNAVRLAATAVSRGDNEIKTIKEVDTIMDLDGAGPGLVQTARVVERHRNTAAFRALGISTEGGPSLGVGCVNSTVHTGLELEGVVGGGGHGAHKAGRSCEEGDGLLGKVHLFKRISLLVFILVFFGWGRLSLPCNKLWL